MNNIPKGAHAYAPNAVGNVALHNERLLKELYYVPLTVKQLSNLVPEPRGLRPPRSGYDGNVRELGCFVRHHCVNQRRMDFALPLGGPPLTQAMTQASGH